MATTEADRIESEKFCNEIGCTVQHHLREQLPEFVAKIREAEQKRCLDIVESEDELTQLPGITVRIVMAFMSKIALCRAATKAAKVSIARRITHGSDFKCHCRGPLDMPTCVVHKSFVNG